MLPMRMTLQPPEVTEDTEGDEDDDRPRRGLAPLSQNVAEGGQFSGDTTASSEAIRVAMALPDQPTKQLPQSQPKSTEGLEQNREASQRFPDETRGGPVQLAQTAAGSNPQPFVVSGSKASGGATNPKTGPYSKSFLSPRFRFELHKRESQVLNYQERQKGGKALGRYQFENISFRQIGMVEKGPENLDRQIWRV